MEIDDPDPDVVRSLADGEIDWIAVTSGATARSLVRLYGDALHSAKIASISPMTSQALHELGHPPTTEAAPPTVAGLVDAITCYRANATGDLQEGGTLLAMS